MLAPFIFIGTYKIKRGQLDQARTALRELVELVQANEPRLIAFNVYRDEPATTVSIVQIHPDAASMEFHMKVVAEHMSSAFDYLDTTESEQAYGPPSDALSALLRQYAEPGVPTTSLPVHEGGFTRAAAT